MISFAEFKLGVSKAVLDAHGIETGCSRPLQTSASAIAASCEPLQRSVTKKGGGAGFHHGRGSDVCIEIQGVKLLEGAAVLGHCQLPKKLA